MVVSKGGTSGAKDPTKMQSRESHRSGFPVLLWHCVTKSKHLSTAKSETETQELVKHVSMSPQNGRRKQYWFFGPFSVLSRFLCQVLNQTWDLLDFFMFTSPISSKQSDLTIPLPFQTAKQSAKQPQLSKNEANWMGISIWAWPLTLFRKLNSLASSGIIQRIVGFSAKLLSNLATSCWIPEMHCMLA